jgi:hypothetical protein
VIQYQILKTSAFSAAGSQSRNIFAVRFFSEKTAMPKFKQFLSEDLLGTRRQ